MTFTPFFWSFSGLSSWRKSTNQSWPASKRKPLNKTSRSQPRYNSFPLELQLGHLDQLLGQKGFIAEERNPSTTRCHPTCLKLPFFLCSQSIMSWKMGIMIFRTSGCGTSVTPRKGPIIPGIKWILCSPEQQNQQVLVYACSAPSQKLPSRATAHDLICTGNVWEQSKLSLMAFWDTPTLGFLAS